MYFLSWNPVWFMWFVGEETDLGMCRRMGLCQESWNMFTSYDKFVALHHVFNHLCPLSYFIITFQSVYVLEQWIMQNVLSVFPLISCANLVNARTNYKWFCTPKPTTDEAIQYWVRYACHVLFTWMVCKDPPTSIPTYVCFMKWS